MGEAPCPLDRTSGAQVVPVSDAPGGEVRGIGPGRDMGDATFDARARRIMHRTRIIDDQPPSSGEIP
ncbi:MAG: hypothetical protein ACE5FR_03490 [Rhodospirillales bacterium]